MKSNTFFVLASAFATACAADPGTRPHDMSQASHEAAADQETQASVAHSTQYDPAAESQTKNCGRGGCWTSSSNPTKEHDADAQRHRELAAKHRAASAVLAQAEAQACVGVSEDDRDISPFFHREDIRSAGPLMEQIRTGKTVNAKRVGASVVFRAVPGMTAEWLQRVVDCHLARAAAAGHQMPEMEYCPLELNNVTAKVVSVGDGFAVNIKSDDSATADLILKRAEGLVAVPAGGNPPTAQATK
ncbi:MAG TPA: hypothetical protein VG937_00335 [Polyangiaceae bacterium]|nr:hypothetical protein [Polyangiaceae bacterium]